MNPDMKPWWPFTASLSAILMILTLGCGSTTSVEAPAKPNPADANPSGVEAVTAQRLAECLAAMFPQMSRDELEREAQMRMADAEAVKNAEAFVERFCGNGQTPGQVPKNAAPSTPAVTTPAGSAATQSVSVRGLGVTRAEMEDFFLAKIEKERATFTSVGEADGEGQLTEIEWDGWGRRNRLRTGKYAVLAGKDENIYGVAFAYEAGGPDQPDEDEILSLLDRVAPTKNIDPQSAKPSSDRSGWVFRYFKNSSCGRGGGGSGGGGLSNILTSPYKSYGPVPTRTPYAIVQNGVEMRLACRDGIYIVSIKAVDSTGATID